MNRMIRMKIINLRYPFSERTLTSGQQLIKSLQAKQQINNSDLKNPIGYFSQLKSDSILKNERHAFLSFCDILESSIRQDNFTHAQIRNMRNILYHLSVINAERRYLNFQSIFSQSFRANVEKILLSESEKGVKQVEELGRSYVAIITSSSIPSYKNTIHIANQLNNKLQNLLKNQCLEVDREILTEVLKAMTKKYEFLTSQKNLSQTIVLFFRKLHSKLSLTQKIKLYFYLTQSIIILKSESLSFQKSIQSQITHLSRPLHKADWGAFVYFAHNCPTHSYLRFQSLYKYQLSKWIQLLDLERDCNDQGGLISNINVILGVSKLGYDIRVFSMEGQEKVVNIFIKLIDGFSKEDPKKLIKIIMLLVGNKFFSQQSMIRLLPAILNHPSLGSSIQIIYSWTMMDIFSPKFDSFVQGIEPKSLITKMKMQEKKENIMNLCIIAKYAEKSENLSSNLNAKIKATYQKIGADMRNLEQFHHFKFFYNFIENEYNLLANFHKLFKRHFYKALAMSIEQKQFLSFIQYSLVAVNNSQDLPILWKSAIKSAVDIEIMDRIIWGLRAVQDHEYIIKNILQLLHSHSQLYFTSENSEHYFNNLFMFLSSTATIQSVTPASSSHFYQIMTKISRCTVNNEASQRKIQNLIICFLQRNIESARSSYEFILYLQALIDCLPKYKNHQLMKMIVDFGLELNLLTPAACQHICSTNFTINRNQFKLLFQIVAHQHKIKPILDLQNLEEVLRTRCYIIFRFGSIPQQWLKKHEAAIIRALPKLKQYDLYLCIIHYSLAPDHIKYLQLILSHLHEISAWTYHNYLIRALGKLCVKYNLHEGSNTQQIRRFLAKFVLFHCKNMGKMRDLNVSVHIQLLDMCHKFNIRSHQYCNRILQDAFHRNFTFEVYAKIFTSVSKIMRITQPKFVKFLEQKLRLSKVNSQFLPILLSEVERDFLINPHKYTLELMQSLENIDRLCKHVLVTKYKNQQGTLSKINDIPVNSTVFTVDASHETMKLLAKIIEGNVETSVIGGNNFLVSQSKQLKQLKVYGVIHHRHKYGATDVSLIHSLKVLVANIYGISVDSVFLCYQSVISSQQGGLSITEIENEINNWNIGLLEEEL